MTLSGKLSPEKMLRETMMAELEISTVFRPHPEQRGADGTKYISAFLAKSGKTFAIDKTSWIGSSIWIFHSPTVRTRL